MPDPHRPATALAITLLLGGLLSGCASATTGRPEAAPAAAGSQHTVSTVGLNPCTFILPETRKLGLVAEGTTPDQPVGFRGCDFDTPNPGGIGVTFGFWDHDNPFTFNYSQQTTHRVTVGRFRGVEITAGIADTCDINLAVGPNSTASFVVNYRPGDNASACPVVESLAKSVEPRLPA